MMTGKREETAAMTIMFSVANHRSDSQFPDMKDQDSLTPLSQYLTAHPVH
jgi:hypothetical protein